MRGGWLWMSFAAVIAALLASMLSTRFRMTSTATVTGHAASNFPRSCGVSLLKGRRLQMEDAAVCIAELCVVDGLALSYYAVFDGHEGDAAARFAKEELHGFIRNQLQRRGKWLASDAGVRGLIRKAFAEANSAFLRMAREQNWNDGTTVVLAVGLGNRFVVAHAGDSRAILCANATSSAATAAGQGAGLKRSQQGHSGWTSLPSDATISTRLLTEDHHPGREDERQRITDAGGFVQQVNSDKWRLMGDLSVSRSLGDLPYLGRGLSSDPEVSSWVDTAGAADGSHPEFLVLASDGLFEAMSADEVCRAAHSLATGKGVQHTPPGPAPIALPGPGGIAEDPEASKQTPALIIGQEAPNGADAANRGTEEGDTSAAPEQLIADWLAAEALNRRSMDNIAVVVVDIRGAPPLGWGQMSPAAKQDAGPVQPGSLVAASGRQHTYRLQRHITQLPQTLHTHGPHESALSVRAGDQLEARHGQAADWHSVCHAIFEGGAGEEEAPGLLALEAGSRELITRLAAVPPAGLLEFTGGQAKPEDSREGPTLHHWEAGDAPHRAWRLRDQLGRGSFGDVWHAVRTGADNQEGGRAEPLRSDETAFVLKRMHSGKHGASKRRESFLREAYFGKRVNELPARVCDCAAAGCPDGRQHLARFVESFEAGQDLWLVFRDEGTSLHNLMYSVASKSGCASCRGNQGVLLRASQWWSELRTSQEGDEVLRDLLRQVLLALETLHAANITHRDVKPENLLLRQHEASETESRLPKFHLRLIDFGSAVDAFSIGNLYGASGPSKDEQTQEYAPPEALLGRYWTGTRVARTTWPYDMWAAGVTWLELIFGTPHVFSISERMRILLEQALHLEHQTPEERELAYWLRGVMQLCIYPPAPDVAQFKPGAAGQQRAGSPTRERLDSVPVAWSCAKEAVLAAIRERDPLGRGLPSPVALRLLQVLLHWNPASRPTPRQALLHAFFTLPLEEHQNATCHGDPNQAGWC